MGEMPITGKPLILLVDDRVENLISLESVLENLDTETYRALSGNEALALTLKHDFALVLLDVQMPEMDGFETAELMRSNPKTRHLPIIFLTAGMKESQWQFKGYDSGAVDYLTKPIEPVILRSKVTVFRDLYLQRRELEMHRKNLQTLVDFKTSQLRQAAQELEQRVIERTEELQQANRQLESFAYSVSHDLRAPVRHIDAFGKILLEDYRANFEPGAMDILNRIIADCGTMDSLIDAILALSTTSRQPLNKLPVSMERLAGEAYEQLGEKHGGGQVEFVVGELPECQADPLLLRQVLVNLIGNAIKYSSKRDNPRIEVSSLLHDDGRVYFVRDNGVGFDMKYADKLFAVFQRLHDSREYGGTGVGLAIAQNIIQRHGGKIWAESEPDHGATFYFTL